MASRKANLPNVQQPDITPTEMSNQIQLVDTLRNLLTINIRDNKAIEERIMWFFDYCKENSLRPGVELLALSLGVTRKTLWMWEKEETERGRLIRGAKQTLAALLEQWGLRNQINPVAYIFNMKNHYGYVDSYEIEHESENKLDSLPSKQDILDRLPKGDSDTELLDMDADVDLDEDNK